jgi:general secretion pathway protein A
MIEAAFNLSRMPFTKEIRASEMLQLKAQTELTARLEHVRAHRGLFLLTGAPGTGKTAALRAWLSGLNESDHKIVYLPLATISPLDFYCELNAAFGGEPAFRKARLFRSLQAAVCHWIETSRRLPILIFDEAHSLPQRTLLELPMLLNFKMDSHDPMVTILAGHEQLEARLRTPLLRHIDQRVNLRYEMTALSEEDSISYIKHHLQLAGAGEDLLTNGVDAAIARAADGVPRRINRIATDAMSLAALEGRDRVTEDDIFNATKPI